MIIGIVGFINSGKGTVGDLLKYHYGFETESFAKPLKDAASAMFGWDRRMLEGADGFSREWREKVDPFWAEALGNPNFTPRLALQLLGTEAGRNVFGDKLWTTSCIRRCQGYGGSTATRGEIENYVITDCRFRNEINAIKEVNGVVIRVKRGLEPSWYEDALSYPAPSPLKKLTAEDFSRYKYNHLCRFMEDYNNTTSPQIHQSEWDWVGANFDYVLENDGSVADLQQKVYDTLVDMKLVHRPFRESYIKGEELK